MSMIQIKSYDLNDYNHGHKCNLQLKTKIQLVDKQVAHIV